MLVTEMKKVLFGFLRSLFELVQLILRPIGKIGMVITGIGLVAGFFGFVLMGSWDASALADGTLQKALLIMFGAFIFFTIIRWIGTHRLPVKVEQEVTVKIVDEKPKADDADAHKENQNSADNGNIGHTP